MSKAAKAVSSNMKTKRSFDPNTLCPRVELGTPCAYCYVEAHRDAQDTFAKSIRVDSSYNGEVLRMRSHTIEELNKMGGIRMFGSTDYRRSDRPFVCAFLNDCQTVGLKAKAITKSSAFVRDWHPHSALAVIDVSVDNLRFSDLKGSPLRIDRARKLREEFYKVRIRAVVLQKEEVEKYGSDPTVDILTLYHGCDKRFYNFSARERITIYGQYPQRVCCQFGKCDTCNSLCGLGLRPTSTQ